VNRKISDKAQDASHRRVAVNRRASHEYEILDRIEAGMMLVGSEVKSLRDGKIQLSEGYAAVDHGELFLHQVHIPEYRFGNAFNHEPTRRRKLLVHRRELDRLESSLAEKGLTLIPLELYFLQGRAKVLLGLCRGRATYDKRHKIRDQEERRSVERTLREHNKGANRS
jgi:SsrA-binding protein